MAARLQKIIAESGLCSRRKAELLIQEGRVKLNGKVAEIGQTGSYEDDIYVDGRKISFQEKHYLAFNKPIKVESALKSTQGKETIGDHIVNYKPGLRLYNVGRLDYMTEGLILVTNDGDFANKIMHPSYEIEKKYEGRLDKPIRSDVAKNIEKGVRLSDGKSWPAKLRYADNRFTITIHEGRNRIVRRLFESQGYKVKQLKRTRVGPVQLEGLRSGKFRDLTNKEIKEVMELE